jgi:hypothetical protein
MKTIITALVAATFVAGAAAANAQGREDLETGIHGNTPVHSYSAAPRAQVSQDARGAFAQVGPRSVQQFDARYANPLLSDIHGNTN